MKLPVVWLFNVLFMALVSTVLIVLASVLDAQDRQLGN